VKQEELERRAFLFTLLILLVFIALGGRLALLQLVEGERWAALAQGQRIKRVEITAPRGEILAAGGEVLAGNRPGYTVSLVYTGRDMSIDTLNTLTRILSETGEGPQHNSGLSNVRDSDGLGEDSGSSEQITRIIRQAIKKVKKNPLVPAEVAVDVPPEVVTALHEHMYELPGVIVEVKPIRTYPYSELASHVLGFVASIEKKHLDSAFQQKWGLSDVGYQGDDLVGKAGVEDVLAFDRVLRGEDGIKLVEVDARGRPVETGLGQDDPVAGNSLRLTIDAELQAVAEQALEKTVLRLQQGLDPMDFDPRTGLPLPFGYSGITYKVQGGENTEVTGGAAVVLDVNTGAVLAMASWPSFDPNRFSLAPHLLPGTDRQKAWADYYEALSNDRARKPLINKAIRELYPPGSAYKPITAMTALEANRTIGRITCGGVWTRYGIHWGDWAAHGAGIGLTEAIRDSCNVYFYQVADRLTLDRGSTTLVATAEQGEQLLAVESVGGFVPGDYVSIGEGDDSEVHEIGWVDRNQGLLQLVVSPDESGVLGRRWLAGTKVLEVKNRWNNPTAWVAREFGLDAPTGLRGLPPGTEGGGEVPDADMVPKVRPNNPRWLPGDSLNAAIGQGFHGYTPLQLAYYTATLANGGQRWIPYLVSESITPDGTVEPICEPLLAGRARVSPASMETVRQAMLAVTQPGGTAYWRFSDWQAYGFPVHTAGKTGTAETSGTSHGIYIGFAPYEDPEIAIAVVVEHGNGGSLAAAPVARAIFDEYFDYADFWESRRPESDTEDDGPVRWELERTYRTW